ncbi:MAG: sigma-70 family RNA polymerase sigma factor [Gaiellaceae bacterium]
MATAQSAAAVELEQYRRELIGYCYRMLGSAFEAEDAVQETMLRAWRSLEKFEGRAALKSWLYKIATNVCLDALAGRERRARPMDLGPAGAPSVENLVDQRPEVTWITPLPTPDELAEQRETLRLAFVAALQHLPAKQRAALILCEALHWQASEAAELLETSVASINSALQRARATLATADIAAPAELDADARALLERYVTAFEAYDLDRLAEILHSDAVMSMPPYALWLQGRDDVFSFFYGPGIGCKDSKLVPVGLVNGMPAWGQYKPAAEGGYEPWAIIVPEVSEGRIAELTFFLDTARLFPLFSLPDSVA